MLNTTKICTNCQQEKTIDEFSPLKHAKDGKQTQCKVCMKVRAKLYAKKNPAKIKQRAQTYYTNNREHCIAASLKWYNEHPEQAELNRRRHYDLNRDARILYAVEYSRKHKEQVTEYVNRRRAQKLRAMPWWLSEEHLKQIKQIYVDAKEQQLEVDHIVPLQGKNVSGLHVPWNLQLLTKSENSSKSNKFNDWN